MAVRLSILEHGNCEPFKAAIHGAALSLAVVMGLYNAAAWLHRRERHLWVNAVVYGLLTEYERRLVAHHINSCRTLALVVAQNAQHANERGQTNATHAA
jgi:hypothetical protein